MSGRPRRVRQALKNRWTNQLGLMQSGSAPRIGKQGPILSLLGRRVNSRLQTCGQGYKGLRCLYELDPNNIGDEAAKKYCKRVVNSDPLTVCNIRQPKNRQNAGGVGNIYTSRRQHCNTNCQQELPCVSLIENFSTGSLGNSDLFIPFDNTQLDHHNIAIVKSGEKWQGDPDPNATFYRCCDGMQDGFISNAAPLITPYYARFGLKGEEDDGGDEQGRYLKSKKFNFTNLVSITVSFIAGGINGELLTPHHRHLLKDRLANPLPGQNPFAYLKTNSVLGTYLTNHFYKLLNGGDIPDVHPGPPREPEDLFIQFYTKDNQPIGNFMSIFTPKDRPAIAGKGDLYIYGSSKFSTKTFYTTDKAILNQASYFKIQQRRQTDILDNYGIKYVQCNFCNDRQMPLPNTPPDISYEVFVRSPPV